MGKIVASISAPSDLKKKFKEYLPMFREVVGPLSTFVVDAVLKGRIMDKAQLQRYVAKEALTSRNKYFILELSEDD